MDETRAQRTRRQARKMAGLQAEAAEQHRIASETDRAVELAAQSWDAPCYPDRGDDEHKETKPGKPPSDAGSEETGGDATEKAGPSTTNEEIKEMVIGLSQKFDDLASAKKLPEWVERKRILALRDFLEEVCDYKVPSKIRNLKRRLKRANRMPPHIEPHDKGTSFKYYMKDLYYWWIDNQVDLNLPDMVLT